MSEPRRWVASGPHDGTPPWAVGLVGIGPVLWFGKQDAAVLTAERLNLLEEYLAAPTPVEEEDGK